MLWQGGMRDWRLVNKGTMRNSINNSLAQYATLNMTCHAAQNRKVRLLALG
jgi:hypothetical protein